MRALEPEQHSDVVAAVGVTLTAAAPTGLGANVANAPGTASHHQAPRTAADPQHGNTDMHAFTGPDKPDTVTSIANWILNEEPNGAPSFYAAGRLALRQQHRQQRRELRHFAPRSPSSPVFYGAAVASNVPPERLMIPVRHDPQARGFASDNYSGVHPEVLEAVVAANGGHLSSYGNDPYTGHLQAVFRQHFGPRAQAFPVLNGTGANVVALQAATTRWGAVICTTTAHIHVDECGAPEHVGGLKLLPVRTPDGKLTPELIDVEARGFDDEHRAQPQVVSVTQSTELGTLYDVEELRAICEHAHGKGMKVHLDGARIANAAAALNLPFQSFTTDVGVDIVSFGGTKNGLMLGEVVVVLDPELAAGMLHLRKMSMQLGSKMRFVSAQFVALLGGDLWQRNATTANQMAQRLAQALRDVPGLTITRAVQANAVFATLPPAVTERLQAKFQFYTWDQAASEVRWMTSFDTTPADVDTFAAAVRDELTA